jgi:glutamate decarboxylase
MPVTVNAKTTVIVLRVPPCRCTGYLPFLLSATAGTTVIGAFDPLDQLADVCKKYDLWLHVDVSLPGRK